MNDFAKHLANLHSIADTCPYDFGMMHLIAEPDGFLGAGADLLPSTLLHAYRSGVFPWFHHDDPICWWSPAERCVLSPDDFLPKKSLVRTAKKQSEWTLTTNLAFEQVVHACSQPRSYSQDTWIHQEMKTAYLTLHRQNAAASIEIWEGTPQQSELIGGLYGINIGAIFCGESMFHTRTDASKIAFWGLMTLAKRTGITLIDCQLENPHLMSLGAKIITREQFLSQLGTLSTTPVQGLNGQTFTLKMADLADC